MIMEGDGESQPTEGVGWELFAIALHLCSSFSVMPWPSRKTSSSVTSRVCCARSLVVPARYCSTVDALFSSTRRAASRMASGSLTWLSPLRSTMVRAESPDADRLEAVRTLAARANGEFLATTSHEIRESGTALYVERVSASKASSPATRTARTPPSRG